MQTDPRCPLDESPRSQSRHDEDEADDEEGDDALCGDVGQPLQGKGLRKGL